MDTLKFLKGNLTRYYVFYIPFKVVSKLESTVFKSAIPVEACNTIIFLDDKNDVSTNFKNVNALHFVNKKEILDYNISLLFEAKQKLDDKHFGFVLETYKKFLEAHLFATQWMYYNVSKEFPNVEERIVTFFKIQKENFEIHNTEFITHFDIKNLELLDINLQPENHFKNSFSNTDFKIEVPEFQKSKSFRNTNTKNSKKKNELIREEEVDRFLLTTVFNVKL